jgi:uncharacterized protein
VNVLVSGSSGLIGTALAQELQRTGHDVTRLVRSRPNRGEVGWDPGRGEIDAAGLEGHDAAVHLAGVSIGGRRWNEGHKKRVLDSRVASTTLLAKELAALDRPPQVLLSASAVGFYGDRGDEELWEHSLGGEGFMADVCRRWEAATSPADKAGIRVVNLRSGLVLDPTGGILKPQLLPFKFGLGAKLGAGRQWVSWISLRDEVRAILHLLDEGSIRGPVNLTAPRPVRNSHFTAALAAALHRPAVLFLPAPVLRLVLGSEMAQELLLVSQRVVPGILTSSGYEFLDPNLEPTLRAMLHRR